ncbi:quinone-dependent dihydroorotate dehydrogenase [Labrys sp. KNU-23]|uniref:quinone-dependent dihydroorotate dehydrogenase n=1 Tax=Labrys sp. KNU-23 TaxID=2789216 RepID=UPI0011ECA09D|nr:quinone-dependent dihydroorotate dehydrogenase [Labrys sp. KNU-23]QEN89545.1 quinone-dependent dihydroorotate dehydrogenase [Labrys sp. KNU-23]
MIGAAFALIRPRLFRMDPEQAHEATLSALRSLPMPPSLPDPASLKVTAFGLDFPNPVGVAAGFDKNAEVVDPLFKLGFGFVEIGSVTPRPQEGNPRPRLFRLPADEGVINRFGFNNQGHAAVLARLKARKGRGILGVNVGANKDSEDKAADYAAGIIVFAPVASYFTLNISSPNTPGLRNLQKREALDELLARAVEARDTAALIGPRRPLLLKIAPDVSMFELDDIVDRALAHKLDGMIVSNTTISRPETLRESETAKEAGGLSGAPLFELSTQVLAETARRVGGRFPLIGVGGIHSAETAKAKLAAGATLVQLYSSLVYKGPGLIRQIKKGLR